MDIEKIKSMEILNNETLSEDMEDMETLVYDNFEVLVP